MRRLSRFFLCVMLLAVMSGAWLNSNTKSSASSTPDTAAVQKGLVSADGLWQDAPNFGVAALKSVQGKDQWIVPNAYKASYLNDAVLSNMLSQAPLEFSEAARTNKVVISLPLPDGSFGRFQVVESPIMGPELAAQWPQIKTYLGQGIDDPTATVRFDVSPVGLRAQILSADDTVFVDPARRGNTNMYLSYSKKDYSRPDKFFTCEVKDLGLPTESELNYTTQTLPTENPIRLRTYRLVVCANAEYGNDAGGGNLATAQAAVVTTVNRVTGLYERDMAIRLNLVQSYVFVGSTTSDPFTDTANTDATTSWTENTNYINAHLSGGTASYDVGHFFSTGAGGAGDIGQVCVSSRKANGATGQAHPIGDAYDIDYVAHEMGHQFGGRHTFNSSPSGSASGCIPGARDTSGPIVNAVEPGSGSTVMAYNGICGAQDLNAIGAGEGANGQVLTGGSDDYFHSTSVERIVNNVTSGTSTCGAQTVTANNRPTVDAGASYTIPTGTPFTLTAVSGSDPDGDALTYCWEEMDQGTAITTGSVPNPDLGNNPIFRSWQPSTSRSRTLPELAVILNDQTKETRPGRYAKSLKGEVLPTSARTMRFRCTVRDNRAGGGGVSWGEMNVTTVSSGGAFSVTSPNTAVTWPSGSTQTVTWNVAGTSAGSVNCPNVRITLSLDGGVTFPTVLASSVPNSGSASVTMPGAISSTTARVKVEGLGNIFFDISNTNFTVSAGGGCSFTVSPTSVSVAAAGGSSSVTVTTQTGCNWSASSGAAWITTTASGTGNGTASFTVAANTGTTSRTGSLTVAGQAVTVTQSGTGGGGGGSQTVTYSATPGTAIPDNNTTGITSTINVPDALTITSVSCSVNITHTYRGDLKIDLVSPTGTTTNLKASSGSDSAANVIATYTPTAFAGQASNGNWQLKVVDTAAVDVGTLNNWSLTITGTTGGGGGTTGDFSISFSPTTGSWTRGSSYVRTVTVTRTGGLTDPITLSYSASKTGLFTSVSASVNPLTTSSTSSVMTFRVSSSAPTGAATVTVIGTDSSGRQRTKVLSLTIL